MGAIVVIIGIALMIIIHEGAHFAAAKAFDMKATEAFFGFGPTLVKTTRGETTYGVKAFPLGGYVRIIGMNPFEEIEEGDEERTYRAAPFWKKAVVVLAGVVSHLVVAFGIFVVVALVWGVVSTDDNGDPIPTTTVGRVAETLADGSPTPAASSGIRAGDTIVTFDGMPIATWDDFGEAADSHPNETVVIGVLRDGDAIELTVTLAQVQKPVIVDGEPLVDDNGDPVTRSAGFFGVTPTVATGSVGFFGAIGEAGENLWFAATQSVRGLWEMVINFPKVVMAAFGGDDEVLDTARPISPIGLVQIAGPVESSLLLLAYVNVFVAVLNVVPLYPLDGGHFAVALYEKIRGRAPDVRKLMPVAVAVFAFVVALGLLGIYFDIVRPLQL
jgi:membrane-associated protease RseP (regulator of RpoE activity)